jgi:Domain of unknown function (DUF4259)
MGAWGTNSFGNDEAADWAFQLEGYDDLSLIEETIAKATVPPAEYLDASDASEAIAAVEAVARLQGHWGERSAYTEPLDIWVERMKLTPPPALVNTALAALDRIVAEHSELRELWDDSDDAAAWLAAVAELRGRVRR